VVEGDIKSCFESVWVGLAGMDRPGYRDQLSPLLARDFGLAGTPGQLRVTNDVDLLAAAMRQHPDVTSAIVIIAGTGSVCMRYIMADDCTEVVQVARSGGWGHLLGDEGAGYTIGREAIKHTLSFIEDQKLGLQDRSPSILERGIMEYFGCGSSDNETTFDLLSDILTSHPEQSVKSRISGTARVVLTVASSDKTAADIIFSQASHLVDNTLSRLLDPRCRGYVSPAQSGLILSGSVMLNEAYQAAFRQKLSERRIQFRYTQTVIDAAATGAQYLASTNWHLP
jgi:N-acetylmuramic acid 6-phosphate etherase